MSTDLATVTVDEVEAQWRAFVRLARGLPEHRQRILVTMFVADERRRLAECKYDSNRDGRPHLRADRFLDGIDRKLGAVDLHVQRAFEALTEAVEAYHARLEAVPYDDARAAHRDYTAALRRAELHLMDGRSVRESTVTHTQTLPFPTRRRT